MMSTRVALGRPSRSLRVHMAEECSHARGGGVEVDVLDRHAEGAVAGLAAAALGRAHRNPVGGAVAGAGEAIALDEGLEEMDRMAVASLPIGGQPSGDAPSHMAG